MLELLVALVLILLVIILFLILRFSGKIEKVSTPMKSRATEIYEKGSLKVLLAAKEDIFLFQRDHRTRETLTT